MITIGCEKIGMSQSPRMATWLCVGNYAIHSYINAVLRGSFRHKNISTRLVNCASGKKRHDLNLPLVDPGKLCFGI